MNKPDSSTPFSDENTLPVPNSPGTWFYQATQLPVTVIRKDDGKLYFQGGANGEEEMEVGAFGKLKAANAEIFLFGFVRLQPILDVPISNN